jgi:CSLREA domain-containing protein
LIGEGILAVAGTPEEVAMHCPRFFPLPLLLSLLVLAACGEDQSTAPTPSGAAAGSAFSTASLKVVNSLADPGNGICNAAQCTLREAINAAGSTEITFAPGLTGSITLARPAAGGGTLRIGKSLTITGPSTGIVIRRRSTDPAFRILRVGESATVKLTNLTIRGGKTDLTGGGIVNRGILELIHCTVSGNSASQGVAGIDNFARLTLRHSTVADNAGAGINNYTDGTLTLRNSTVANNTGLGIGNSGGDVALTLSTVSNNSFGIGSDRGRVRLTESRVVANNGSGVGTYLATVVLLNSTVAQNHGSGIDAGRGSFVDIISSTISANSGDEGGGIHLRAFHRGGTFVRLTNSTVSGNSARLGGGIRTDGSDEFAPAWVELINSTVAFNSATERGGGIFHDAGDPSVFSSLTNSIVAQNSAPASPDVFGTPRDAERLFDAHFSLIGDGTGSDITNTDGNLVGNVPPHTAPIDPMLGPLADNGGPTRTHALLPGSPATDAASTPECPATDQRGVARPQGAGCDIGSYERE